MGVAIINERSGPPIQRVPFNEPEQPEALPYRPLPVVQSATSPGAYCPWCSYRGRVSGAYESEERSWTCMAPLRVTIRPWGPETSRRQRCDTKNIDGLCEDYRPSLWTRLLLALGIRKPKRFA